MIHAAAKGEPYACFVRPDTQIPFMAMPDGIAALLALARAPKAALTRTAYNPAAFNPTAEQIRDEVIRAFPKADITWRNDVKRQGIVDSWPADVDDEAARRDWGFAPQYDFHRAFRDYLIPTIGSRYGK
jgi:threonine 3-dehydrogenase